MSFDKTKNCFHIFFNYVIKNTKPNIVNIEYKKYNKYMIIFSLSL